MDLKYELESLEICPICRKQVKGRYVHDENIVLTIECNSCNLTMSDTIVSLTGGNAIEFISSVAHRYAALIRKWNRRTEKKDET